MGPQPTVLIIEVSLFSSVHNSRFHCTCSVARQSSVTAGWVGVWHSRGMEMLIQLGLLQADMVVQMVCADNVRMRIAILDDGSISSTPY